MASYLVDMKPPAANWLAGGCAILAAISGFCYAIAFIILPAAAPGVSGPLSALFLMLLGLFATGAFVGLYERIGQAQPATALWALLLLLAGAFGSLVHGGYDLANQLHPPAQANLDLPSQVDPRGLLTFGVGGLGLIIACSLIVRSERLPKGLAYLGYLSGVLSIALYLGRLIVLLPSSPIILAPALVNGFVVGPLWYLWLGLQLRGRTRSARSSAAANVGRRLATG